MKSVDLAAHLRAGDLVVIGQGTAEPPSLLQQLIAAAPATADLTAFCGYSLSAAWNEIGDDGPRVRAYIAHGALRSLVARGLLDMLPWHLSVVEQYITSGRIRPDVVLLQVAPKDENGYYNLGPTVDYAVVAAGHAREVVVEVNPRIPRTRSKRRLHESLVTGVLEVEAELAGSPNRPASEVEKRLAKHVASLVPSGATIQLGLSALADEVARELRHRKGLKVRSGLVGDWLVDLYQAGAMASGPDTAVVGMAVGSRRLYDFVESNEAVFFAPTQEIVDPVSMRACTPFVSINSAIEVDLTGAINAEVVAGRYVGAVGGQVDFFRGSRASVDGMAIVALSAMHPSGESRIVPGLQGPTTSLKSDVDLVVTEFGIADLRAASLRERAHRLAAVAAPQYAEALGGSAGFNTADLNTPSTSGPA